MKIHIHKKYTVIALVLTAIIFSSCATYHPQKMKTDFVGFSDEVTTSYSYTNKCMVKKWRKQSPPFDLITSEGKKNNEGEEQMQIAVYGLQQGTQTAAYYALDAALDRMEYVQRKFMDKDPESKYYVIMLTDGIDTKVADKAEYNNKLQERMSNIMKRYCFFNLFKSKKPNTTNSFESYVLLYKGKDLKETNLSDGQLRTLLMPFTGFQNAPEEDDRTIIKENINELVDILEAKLVSRSFRFRVPVGFNGENIRMVLTPKGASNPVYFQGDFSKDGKSYSLSNIKTSNGFTIQLPSSEYLTGVPVGNDLIEFKVEDLKWNGKPYKVDKNVVNQWHQMLGTYVYNSEYSSTAASRKNAYLIVLLDGSLSFSEKYKEAQEAIIRIVRIVSEL